jgi:hypothetical protein
MRREIGLPREDLMGREPVDVCSGSSASGTSVRCARVRTTERRGLDGWEREPPAFDHPLLTREDVIITYHTAGVTHEARRNMAAFAAEQIAGLLNGGARRASSIQERGRSLRAASKRYSELRV